MNDGNTKRPGAIDFTELLDAIRTALTEAAIVPQLLDGTAARKYLGLSRSGWFRAAASGLLPRPVHIEGSGDRYRKSDLDAWLARLKPARRRNTNL